MESVATGIASERIVAHAMRAIQPKSPSREMNGVKTRQAAQQLLKSRTPR
jgi:hypothetical protein